MIGRESVRSGNWYCGSASWSLLHRLWLKKWQQQQPYASYSALTFTVGWTGETSSILKHVPGVTLVDIFFPTHFTFDALAGSDKHSRAPERQVGLDRHSLIPSWLWEVLTQAHGMKWIQIHSGHWSHLWPQSCSESAEIKLAIYCHPHSYAHTVTRDVALAQNYLWASVLMFHSWYMVPQGMEAVLFCVITHTSSATLEIGSAVY